MSESIQGPSYHAPLSPNASQTQDVPLLSKQMQTQALALAEHLQKLEGDPSLATQEDFLKEFAANGGQLNTTVEKALLVR